MPKLVHVVLLVIMVIAAKLYMCYMPYTCIGLHIEQKNEVRHGHFKSCRNPMWPFIKTVQSDVNVL